MRMLWGTEVSHQQSTYGPPLFQVNVLREIRSLLIQMRTLDLSFWPFLTFLHHGIEKEERHLLWKPHKNRDSNISSTNDLKVSDMTVFNSISSSPFTVPTICLTNLVDSTSWSTTLDFFLGLLGLRTEERTFFVFVRQAFTCKMSSFLQKFKNIPVYSCRKGDSLLENILESTRRPSAK